MEFSFNSTVGRRVRRSRCRECQAAYDAAKYKKSPEAREKSRLHTWRWNLKHTYGITEEQWAALLASQGGKCPVCLEPPRRPSVDHCHETGRVRGILCQSCNGSIGGLGDDPATLRRAAAYLETVQGIVPSFPEKQRTA